jgi:uncharacterized membrane protein
MKRIIGHIKTNILRGVFASIPFVLTFLVLRLLYVTIDRRIMEMLYSLIGFRVPGLGILLLLIVLYLLGVAASNIAGRYSLNFIERITSRIPIVKTTYQIGKQISDTLSLSENHIFKRPVLVEYLKPGIWTIGFVTGTVTNRANEDEIFLKVFIPTPPNPTSGVMVLVRESQTRDPGWSIEEAIRAVISGGIIGPDEIAIQACGTNSGV